ncbi:MAG: WD40 repeat domain-containing protein [Polyangiaceae bacterium]|nr:WD40 repeat domain-containing protein [Polyangiaceae bacterium]
MRRACLLALSLSACGAPSPPLPAPSATTPIERVAPSASAEPPPVASAAPPPAEEEPRLPAGVDTLGAPLPPVALARFGSDRYRVHAPQAQLLFDAAGVALVADHDEGRLELREIASGRVRRAHPSPAGGAVSPDLSVLVTSDLQLVGVADAVVRRKLTLPTRHEVVRGKPREVTPRVRAVFVSDGARVVVAETSDGVFVFDGDTGALRRTMRSPPLPSKVKGMAALYGPSLTVLGLARSGATLLTHDSTAVFASIPLFSGGASPTEGATAWDVKSGAALRRSSTNPDEPERWLAVSDDGRALLLWRDGRTISIDVRTGSSIAEFDARTTAPRAGALSDDGKLAALARHDLTIQSAEGKELDRIDVDASVIALSSGGSRLAAQRGQTLLVSPEKGVIDEGPPGHARAPREATLSPDGKLLATVAEDGLRLWDARVGKHLGFAPLQSSGQIAFSPRGDTLWLTQGSTLYAVPMGRPATLRTVTKAKTEILALAVAPTSGRIAIATSGAAADRVALVDPASGEQTPLSVPRAFVDEPWRERVRAITFSADGAHLVVVAGVAYVFRVADRELQRKLSAPEGAGWAAAQALGADRVLLGGERPAIVSLSTGEARPLGPEPCLWRATAPEVARIACAKEKRLVVLDATDGHVLVERGLPAPVVAAPLLSPDGARALTFHAGGVAFAWPAR